MGILPTEGYPVQLVTALLEVLRAQLMLRGSVNVLEVVETGEEEDVVTAASKGGQHSVILSPYPVGAAKHVRKEMTYIRHSKVVEYAAEEHVLKVTGSPTDLCGLGRRAKGGIFRLELRS